MHYTVNSSHFLHDAITEVRYNATVLQLEFGGPFLNV